MSQPNDDSFWLVPKKAGLLLTNIADRSSSLLSPRAYRWGVPHLTKGNNAVQSSTVLAVDMGSNQSQGC